MKACLRMLRAPLDLAMRMATNAMQPMAANVNKATSNGTGLLALGRARPLRALQVVIWLQFACAHLMPIVVLGKTSYR